MIDLLITDRRGPAAEAALVLEAVGIGHELAPHPRGWVVRVPEALMGEAQRQLQAYWLENLPSPEKAVPAHIIDSGWAGVLGYLLVIWCVPALEFYTGADWRSVGRMDAVAVSNGEWWRAVTALTLHADLGHIASNSLFGAVFGLFVGRYLGSGFGWLLVVCCGFAGNMANAIVQPGPFYSIGASTATFAALGLVPAFGWRRGFFRGQGPVRGFAPLFAAIALLAFMGFGAENVDALGHIFGFLAGIGLGFGVAKVDVPGFSLGDQRRAGVAAVLLVATAWALGFSLS